LNDRESQSDQRDLFDLLKNVAATAGERLCELGREGRLQHQFDETLAREIKAEADQIIESHILSHLKEVGLPIISEETGSVEGKFETDLGIVIDPIDGTANFIRGLGQSAVSIGLLKNERPIFGVLALYPSGELAWGGAEVGAFIDNKPLRVSKESRKDRGVLCTGIPTRFDMSDLCERNWLTGLLADFAKIRMFGAASVSLLCVAKGSAEIYAEREVMIWDVAAGLAIVLGAGGSVSLEEGGAKHSWNVIAHNGHFSLAADEGKA